ncbi:MAG: hypothetical protein II563_01215 [Treponema sp.]|nr:hypothetical protein [Treponema sp.]MBQ5383647.1 hypothetical protein [Treponema sp.]
MCEVLEEWWQSGIKEGENRVAVEKALAVMDKLNLSKEEAVNVLSLTPVQVKLLDKELAARKKMR